MAQRILVTGGSGFIGGALVEALRVDDIPVTVVDREPCSREDVTSVQGELSDPAVREAALTEDVTAVVHLAAVTSVLKSVEEPARTYAENVGITQELLELARQRGTARFVLASTNAVIGDVGVKTITTDLPPRPLTPYGATKAACEMLLSGYYGAYGLSTCALRFSNVYGQGMGRKDSFVPRMMRAALTGEGVRIYGDGTQRRDLVHVHDVVAALRLAVDGDHVGPAIVGAGESVSVLDMVEATREVTGCEIPMEHIDAPKGEMPAVVVDLSASERDLGYRPTVGLRDGLASTWRYFQGLA
jgi:UDP-glucose 4-epimerase